ncbi:EscR/YscR/HrcR family type III secretion system export apparatus protein [Herbaspirillum sp. RTI4]|uniref:EscR/YscR/HrcR family type III secretion system export apparatus protein n=1 Tax=Herbaspirillum sp. RTI4 TaxID=3048640 RepID=UPI002AB4B0DB|nr:EscR/YscR/HrcR family type III secretion system export apparatus protein [Herbaspirillum sp. RTI4]MDY7578371.1 EscR/YscR/HrcR family type III secretion system export apparatus protein [Herbaspirillum sp. RTI4]MEA9983513.1 EscR/YscR/HrcR family type III secretion system export apparatus protein [Herbaspirillum sp. RTI4]
MNDMSLIAILAIASLLPFLVAAGTCYIKFSIVFVLLRNALGLQQVPSNMVLNSIALMLSMFVMQPVMQDTYNHYVSSHATLNSVSSVKNFIETGLNSYKDYLRKYSDSDLTQFFEKAQKSRIEDLGPANKNSYFSAKDDQDDASLFSLLPAYALSEIKDAFKIGFYLYLPFVVIDLVVSSILLALGMMMMSPVTISVPIKLILFVAMDGWTMLSKGLVMQYLDLAH